MQSLCRLSVWQKSHGTGEAKSHAKYIATKSQPKYISHCNRYMLWKSLAIIRRLLSNQEYQVLSCFWWHFGWRICSSCKIHLNFLPWLHGHANADTLTHSNTNLFHAKKIPMWQSCCGLWTTYFVLGNQESYNSEQWMRHEQILVGFSQMSSYQMFDHRIVHILYTVPWAL